MTDFVYARVLDIKNDARPRSPGSLISQIRDLEQVRELVASQTLSVLIDLPFSATFLFIIWYLGGALVWVPLAAIPTILFLGIIFQFPLARLSSAGLAEASLRNTILMETVFGIEDIKQLQAEDMFRERMLYVTSKLHEINSSQRFFRTLLVNLSQNVQQLAYIGILVVGVYEMFDGRLSSGALMACSILTSRAIAPLGQFTALFSVFQSAKTSKKALDALLRLPIDHDHSNSMFHRQRLIGGIELKDLQYAYPGTERPVLSIPSLNISPGEKVALIGRVGAGKSTLLRLIAGISTPSNGHVLFDGLSESVIDKADVRRDVALALQDSELFFGTVRENLRVANPGLSDEGLAMALRLSCADELLTRHGVGLDLQIRERGIGLSNGQRQSLLLARIFSRSPQIVLLDEPTSSLDDTTEKKVIQNLAAWSSTKTLIMATHRYSTLEIVDRIIVLENGQIVADGPKTEIMSRMKGTQIVTNLRKVST